MFAVDVMCALAAVRSISVARRICLHVAFENLSLPLTCIFKARSSRTGVTHREDQRLFRMLKAPVNTLQRGCDR